MDDWLAKKKLPAVLDHGMAGTKERGLPAGVRMSAHRGGQTLMDMFCLCSKPLLLFISDK